MKKVSIFLGCACFLSLFILQPAYAQWAGFSNPYGFGAYNSYNYGYPYSGFMQPNYGYSWNQPYGYGWDQPSYGWNQTSYGWNQPSYGWNQTSYGDMYPSYYPDTYEYQNTYHWISDPIHGNQYVPIGYGNPFTSAISVPGGHIVPGQGFVAGQGIMY